jgi:hypothetical protein
MTQSVSEGRSMSAITICPRSLGLESITISSMFPSVMYMAFGLPREMLYPLWPRPPSLPGEAEALSQELMERTANLGEG